MLFAVIGNRARASGNRNRVFVIVGTCVDYQLAKHKLHVIVVEVSAGGVGGVEPVLIRIRQDVVFVIPGELVFGQDAIFAHEAVATHSLADIGATLQRLAVVVLVTVFGRQDNGTLANGKHAVTLNPELHVDIVLSRIALERELSFGKAHLVLAGVSALCFRLAGEADIAFTHTSRQTGNVVARDDLLFTGVLLAAVVAGNRNSNLVGNGSDVQVAGRRLGHDILVIGADLADGVFRELIRVVPGVRALAALERHAVEAGAHALGKVRRVAFDALLGAVIGFVIIEIRRQRNVLAVVELHHVLGLVGTELEVLDVIADRRIAVDRLRLKSGDLVAHMAPIALGRKRGVRARPVVLDTIAHLICGVEEVDGRIGAHHACLLAGTGRVALNGNRALHDRLTLHVAGKGLGRRNLDCGLFKIVIHLDRLIASNILAVVVHVLARAHGERYRLRASLVGVPTHELIFHVIDGLLGSRGFGRGGNLRNALFQLVRGSIILSEAGRIGILQIEHRVNRLAALHHHLAVKVVPTTDIRIVRNLVRIKSDFLHVVFRDLSALLLGKRVLPCLENGVPILAIYAVPIERPA